MTRLVSVTLETTARDGLITIPHPIIRLLGLHAGDEVEFRVSGEGLTLEAAASIGADGELAVGQHSTSGRALLTIWAGNGRELESETALSNDALSATEALHRLARELDPAGGGISVRELTSAAEQRGLAAGRSNPYGYVYSLLNSAKDRFDRSGRGRFRWTDPSPGRQVGLGGKELISAAIRWTAERDPDNRGVHYQEIVRGLKLAGTPVKGPDPGRTVYSNLAGPTGARAFERIGSGMFRRRDAASS